MYLIKNYLIFQSTGEVLEEIKSKAWRLYAAEWVVWPPAQIINFYLLPTRFRVLYDNTISLGYDVYTSYVKHDKSWFYLLITLGPTEIYIVHIYRLEQLNVINQVLSLSLLQIRVQLSFGQLDFFSWFESRHPKVWATCATEGISKIALELTSLNK